MSALPPVLPTLFPGPVDWPTVFGREAPLEVELGTGRPHYLFDRALEVPERDIVGIEWKGKMVRMAEKRMAREGIPNVRALHANAWLLFPALFGPGSLEMVHLNCPDPWWKSKHRKRRILHDTFTDQVAARLKPGGLVFIQTDVASLLEAYLEVLEAHPLLSNPFGAGRLCTRKPTTARSHRERRCVADGVPIFRGLVERATEPAA